MRVTRIKQGEVTQATEEQQVAVEERPSTVNRAGAARPPRVPIHGYRNIIGVKGIRPGFHACWVNEDNVERFLEGGYDYVTNDVKIGDRSVKAASQVGGRISKNMGAGVTAFLMECPEEIFKEENDRLNTEVDSTEEGMRKSLNSGQDGLVGKVKIGRTLDDAL